MMTSEELTTTVLFFIGIWAFSSLILDLLPWLARKAWKSLSFRAYRQTSEVVQAIRSVL